MFRKFTSERVRRVRRKRFARTTLLHIVLALSVVTVLWQLSYAPWWRVDALSVRGTKAVSHDEVFATASGVLEGSYLGLFSKRNIFLVPRGSIVRALRSTFPRISSVSVARSGLHILAISVHEHTAEALLCRTTGDECYFMNKDGFVFSEAPQFSSVAFSTYSAKLVDNPIGKTFLASDNGFARLDAFVSSLASLSLAPQRTEITNEYITVTARVGASAIALLFSRAVPFEQSYSNLEAVLRDPGFDVHEVSRIDVRFGNKIFFVPRGEEVFSEDAMTEE